MRSRRFILQALLAASLAGCCSTSERVVVYARGPEDEKLDCEDVCERAIKTDDEARGAELHGCREGLTEQNNPAVLCTFAYQVCSELH